MSIKERAEAVSKALNKTAKNHGYFNWEYVEFGKQKEYLIEAFDWYATEQQALSEARIKELEEALKAVSMDQGMPKWLMDKVNKAINNL